MTKHNLFLWGGFVAVIALIVAGLLLIPTGKPDEPTQTGSPRAVETSDWTRGDPAAPLALIEYSDFQCPACRTYAPLIKQMKDEFGDKLFFVYRHFPLPAHLNAETAATAAEAAGRQGKFWEMHDMIFEKQDDWSPKSKSQARDLFAEYARTLGLDMERFEADWESEAVTDKVTADKNEAAQLKLNYTPTIFLNGKKILNPRTPEEFRDLLNTTLTR